MVENMVSNDFNAPSYVSVMRLTSFPDPPSLTTAMMFKALLSARGAVLDVGAVETCCLSVSGLPTWSKIHEIRDSPWKSNDETKLSLYITLNLCKTVIL